VDERAEAGPLDASVRGPAPRILIGQGDDDDETVLRGHEHVPIPESVQDQAFQRADSGLDRGQAPLWSRQRDLVGASQVQPERFGAVSELAEMGVAAEQVVDQLSSKGLLASNELAARFGMSLCEGSHGVLDDLQHRLGGCSYRRAVAYADNRGKLVPHPPGRGEVEVHPLSRGHAGLGSAPTEQAHRSDLAAGGTAPRYGGLGEHRQVVAEELLRNVTGVVAGALRHLAQPVIVSGSGQRVPLGHGPPARRVVRDSHTGFRSPCRDQANWPPPVDASMPGLGNHSPSFSTGQRPARRSTETTRSLMRDQRIASVAPGPSGRRH
jgi:hypothetical protein